MGKKKNKAAKAQNTGGDSLQAKHDLQEMLNQNKSFSGQAKGQWRYACQLVKKHGENIESCGDSFGLADLYVRAKRDHSDTMARAIASCAKQIWNINIKIKDDGEVYHKKASKPFDAEQLANSKEKRAALYDTPEDGGLQTFKPSTNRKKTGANGSEAPQEMFEVCAKALDKASKAIEKVNPEDKKLEEIKQKMLALMAEAEEYANKLDPSFALSSMAKAILSADKPAANEGGEEEERKTA